MYDLLMRIRSAVSSTSEKMKYNIPLALLPTVMTLAEGVNAEVVDFLPYLN